MHKRLCGKSIVVTRPPAQAGKMQQLLYAQGAGVQIIPLINIAPTAKSAELQYALTRLIQMDGVFFISPSAIDLVMQQQRVWPNPLPVFVTGPGSNACAKRYGIVNIHMPDTTFDSEGLLALPLLQDIAHKHFFIFRGQAGRNVLAKGLIARGASVEFVEAYQRIVPKLSLADWQAFEQSDAVILTSSEAAQNLFAQAGQNQLDWLRRLQYFVSHPRIGLTLQNLGAQVIEPVSASDAQIVTDIVHFFNK